MKISLAPHDPHPSRVSHLIAEWWGKEITVAGPIRPRFEPKCEAAFLYEITGPQELIDYLKQHGLGKYVCLHQVQSESLPDITRPQQPTAEEAQL